MFLACLEVYGSMPNPESTYSNKEYFITDYMTDCRFTTLDQLKELIKRLKKVSKGANSIFQHQQNLQISEENPLINSIVQVDIPYVIDVLKKVEIVFLKKKELCKREAYQNNGSKSELGQLKSIIGDIDDSIEEGKGDYESQIDIERQSQAEVDDSLSSDS